MIKKHEEVIDLLIDIEFNIYQDCFLLWFDKTEYMPLSLKLYFSCTFKNPATLESKTVRAVHQFTDNEARLMDLYAMFKTEELVKLFYNVIKDLIESVENLCESLIGFNFDRVYTKAAHERDIYILKK